VALAVLGLLVFASPSGAPTTLAQGTTPSAQIRITDGGFVPSSITVNPGDSVHWTNESSRSHSVTAVDGLFESGEIVPGGGYSVALAYPGTHAYFSTIDPSLHGDVHVPATTSGARTLSGNPNDPARGRIPDLGFCRGRPRDIARHPTLGVDMSRTRILVTFSPTATVAQINAALATADVTIAGGLPRSGLLLVTAADTPDFSALDRAATALQASPGVQAASISPLMTMSALPRAAELAVRGQLNWDWTNHTSPRRERGPWSRRSSRPPGTCGKRSARATRAS
jgi:plastocyanin